MKPLYTSMQTTKSLTREAVGDMFRVYASVFEGMRAPQFAEKLRRKSQVVLLHHAVHGIVGFSTFDIQETILGAHRIIAATLGNTAVAQPYWGTKLLRIELAKQIAWAKCRRPFLPLYLLLTSMGFKSYVIVAHSFKIFYPNPESATPVHELDLMKSFSQSLCDNPVSIDNAFIIPSSGAGVRPRAGVADPPTSTSDPHIAYFNRLNPGYRDGDRLVCMGKVTFGDMALAGLKLL